jgi:hypothetical protein
VTAPKPEESEQGLPEFPLWSAEKMKASAKTETQQKFATMISDWAQSQIRWALEDIFHEEYDIAHRIQCDPRDGTMVLPFVASLLLYEGNNYEPDMNQREARVNKALSNLEATLKKNEITLTNLERENLREMFAHFQSEGNLAHKH